MACFPQYLMGEPGCRLPGERGDVAPRHESVMRIAPLKPGLRPARGDDALRLADIVGVGLDVHRPNAASRQHRPRADRSPPDRVKRLSTVKRCAWYCCVRVSFSHTKHNFLSA